jgi:hypothetical protein
MDARNRCFLHDRAPQASAGPPGLIGHPGRPPRPVWRSRSRGVAALLCLLALALTRAAPATAQEMGWTRQFGSVESDHAYGVAAAPDGVYVAGSSEGALPGRVHLGSSDAFVFKYDASGVLVWGSQFGTPTYDIARGLASAPDGVYVVGQTYGALPGQTNAGQGDAFIAKYDAVGVQSWARQLGSPASDYGWAVAAGPDGAYVAGYTTGVLPGQASGGGADAFVAKYDPAGALLWSRQFGSAAFDFAHGVAVGSGAVYVVGQTHGALPGQASAGLGDGFVAKLDPAGELLWTRQFGSAEVDLAYAVAVGAEGALVAGYVCGALPGQTSAGGCDAFLAAYDPAGAPRWSRQLGSAASDAASGVAVGPGGIYVSGSAGGALPGQVQAGDADAFVAKFDAAGALLRTRQFGSPLRDEPWGVALTASGLYLAGSTDGALPGQTEAGFADAFLAKVELGSAYEFVGFLPPLAPVSDGSVVNAGKAGRTYPVKWRLRDAGGKPVTRRDAVVSVSVRSVACGGGSRRAGPLAAATVGPGGVRYDAADAQYVFVWQTPPEPGCYELRLALDDGSTRTAAFRLS